MTDPFSSLSTFKPKPKDEPQTQPDRAAIREVAQQHGFLSESAPPLQRRYFRTPGAKREPMMSVSLRLRLADWNAFQEFCAQNRYTAGEGFALLVQQLRKEP